MFEYDEESQKAAEILDKYDLTDALKELRNNRTEIYDVCKSLEQTFPELGTAFEYLSTDEFLDYLHERYNIFYSEEISYYIY